MRPSRMIIALSIIAQKPSNVLSAVRQFSQRASFTTNALQHLPMTIKRDLTTMQGESAAGQARRIGTHNGKFHADEALACFLLKQLPEYKEAAIVRTRDPKILDEMDIVVDVGGTYDVEAKRFDHHQREFQDTFSKEHHTRLSSAGLVYKHFGRQVIANLLDIPLDDANMDILYRRIYDTAIEEYDGVDNGVSRYPSDIEPKYRQSSTISSVVDRLNPRWNDHETDPDVQFMKAVEATGDQISSIILNTAKAWLPARALVEKAVKQRKQYDDKGAILVFEQGGMPWKEHLFAIEEEMQLTEKPVYVIYTDTGGNWRIQCIPLRPDTFENRLSMPAAWRGLRDDALDECVKKDGVPEGCIFVHASGFIGGHKTKEGVLAMARASIRLGSRH